MVLLRGSHSVNMVHQLPNGSKIFIGGRQVAANKEWITAQSIDCVMSMIPENVCEVDGVENLHFPTRDTPDGAKHMLDIADEVAKAIHLVVGTAKRNILVHCRHGKNRSSTAILLYLLRYENFQLTTAQDAFRCYLGVDYREVLAANYFRPMLQDYEKKVTKKK